MGDNRQVVKTYDATGRELHVDVPLSQLVVNYRTQGLLGETIFPVVNVTKQSDMIPVIPLGEFLREEAAFRAPGTQARMVRFNVATMGYYCKNYALKYPITVEDRENSDRVWNLRENGAYFITDLIRIGKERRVCNVVNSGTNVNTAFVAGSVWNGAGNPLTQCITALQRVQDTTGFRPNIGIIGLTAWRAMRVNSAVRGILFPHGGGLASTEQIASLLELDSLQVARGYYNTAAEGATASISPFMSDAFYAFFQPGGNGIGPLPRYGATFRWQLAGVPSMTVEVHGFDQKTKSEEIEVGVYDDERVIDSKLGVSILGVNSEGTGGIA